MTGDAGEEQQDDDSETIERVMDTRTGKKGGKTTSFLIKSISHSSSVLTFFLFVCFSSHRGFNYCVCRGGKRGPK